MLFISHVWIPKNSDAVIVKLFLAALKKVYRVRRQQVIHQEQPEVKIQRLTEMVQEEGEAAIESAVVIAAEVYWKSKATLKNDSESICFHKL